jgi:hypothetical protein
MRARMMFERGIDRNYASYIRFSIVWNEISRRHRPVPANGRTGDESGRRADKANSRGFCNCCF